MTRCVTMHASALQCKELTDMPETRWLLANRYRSPSSLVLLVPPFDTSSASMDDGVRMVSNADELNRFCVVMEHVLSNLGVPFRQLVQNGKQQRLQELLEMINCA